MAYKPYKVPKIEDEKKQKANPGNASSRGSIKLFGFRSGASYKMILAILYYGLMLLIYVPSIINEIIHYDFTVTDVILDISKYLFIGIFLFSPVIFLSDFKYVDSLPFFKKKTFGSSLCGLIIVFMFCYFMWNVDIMCMSQKYNNSIKAYEAQITKEQDDKIKEIKSENTQEKTNFEQTDNTQMESVSK